MPKKELTATEKIAHNLFSSHAEAEINLTVDELEIKKRYMAVITKLLTDPLIPDKQIVNFLKNTFNIEKTQAYKDIGAIKSILGNIKNAGKEWSRYMVIEGLKNCIQKARTSGKIEAEIIALDKLGKYTKLDKEDEELMPWESLIPPDFEMTDDISILDESLSIKDVDNKRDKLRAKYNSAIDVDYQNV
jgi:hypothetical protein